LGAGDSAYSSRDRYCRCRSRSRLPGFHTLPTYLETDADPLPHFSAFSKESSASLTGGSPRRIRQRRRDGAGHRWFMAKVCCCILQGRTYREATAKLLEALNNTGNNAVFQYLAQPGLREIQQRS